MVVAKASIASRPFCSEETIRCHAQWSGKRHEVEADCDPRPHVQLSSAQPVAQLSAMRESSHEQVRGQPEPAGRLTQTSARGVKGPAPLRARSAPRMMGITAGSKSATDQPHHVFDGFWRDLRTAKRQQSETADEYKDAV